MIDFRFEDAERNCRHRAFGLKMPSKETSKVKNRDAPKTACVRMPSISYESGKVEPITMRKAVIICKAKIVLQMCLYCEPMNMATS